MGPHHHNLLSPCSSPPPGAKPLCPKVPEPRLNPEQLCQHNAQLEKLSEHHISLSSLLKLSFSYSFVVNGLGGK